MAGEHGLDADDMAMYEKPVQRRAIPVYEEFATKEWVYKKNPARSGDKKRIAWMTKSDEEFYFEDYRSVAGQIDIITAALKEHPDLRKAASVDAPGNQWLRNVKKYLNAVQEDAVDTLTIPVLRAERTVNDAQLAELVGRQLDGEGDRVERLDGEEKGIEEGKGEVVDIEDGEGEERVLHPRTYTTFYKTILRGVRLWKRPPHDACSRCDDFEKLSNRFKELNLALLSKPDDLEHDACMALITRAGGRQAAWRESREAANALPNLLKHVEWFQEQRKYVKLRELVKAWEAMWYLDYGGFTDSGNKKVSVWSVTVVGLNRKLEHFDFFFDAANQHLQAGISGAKKNGQTGIFFLEEMLDPSKAPAECKGKSIFGCKFPDVTHNIMSGDTGNGYRAYEMLQALSKLFSKFGYTCELIPLSPGHAWNLTDGRIAHMNTFIRLAKASARIFGAKHVASLFHKASDPEMVNSRKFMARSSIFFRVVPQLDVSADKKNLGAMLVHPDVEKGNVGVKGLIYFDFSVAGLEGGVEHPHGYARVREHGNETRMGNKTFVYTWCKDLVKLMCQHCSDTAGRPVLLSVSACTKKVCQVEEAASLAAARVEEQEQKQDPLPLEREFVDGEVVAPLPAVQRRRQATKECKECSAREGTPVPRKTHGCTSTTCKVCEVCSRRERKVVLKNVSGCQKNRCKGGAGQEDSDSSLDSQDSEEEEEEEEDEAEDAEEDKLDEKEEAEEQEEGEEGEAEEGSVAVVGEAGPAAGEVRGEAAEGGVAGVSGVDASRKRSKAGGSDRIDPPEALRNKKRKGYQAPASAFKKVSEFEVGDVVSLHSQNEEEEHVAWVAEVVKKTKGGHPKLYVHYLEPTDALDGGFDYGGKWKQCTGEDGHQVAIQPDIVLSKVIWVNGRMGDEQWDA
jgi:hypothetical protein